MEKEFTPLEFVKVKLQQDPPKKYLVEHEYLKGWLYLPIDKVELLLESIFTRVDIEITACKVELNSCVVIVRLTTYVGDEVYRVVDGIGAAAIQLNAGAGALDFEKMKGYALEIGYPKAYAFAIKNAAERLGRIFGADLNRKHAAPVKEGYWDKVKENYWDKYKSE